MTRKNKIITSALVLSFAIFGMIMGVYALVQRQITIGGSVSFSASTVRATYTVSKTDAYTGETMGTMTQIASGTFNETNQSNANADLGNIMLSDNADRFAYEVVITSTETTRDLHVSFTIPAPTQDWLSVLVNGEETPDTTAIIEAGNSLTVTFVIIADGYNAPETAEDIQIGTSFKIALNEEDAAAEAQARMERQIQRLQREEQMVSNQTKPSHQRQNINNNNVENQNTNQYFTQPEINY